MTAQPAPLADQLASLRAAAKAHTGRHRLTDILDAMIMALLVRIFGRLEQLVRLWQAGLLPSPPTRNPMPPAQPRDATSEKHAHPADLPDRLKTRATEGWRRMFGAGEPCALHGRDVAQGGHRAPRDRNPSPIAVVGPTSPPSRPPSRPPSPQKRAACMSREPARPHGAIANPATRAARSARSSLMPGLRPGSAAVFPQPASAPRPRFFQNRPPPNAPWHVLIVPISL